MSRKIKICIVLSLVANLLLLGVVGGHLLKVVGKETRLPLRTADKLQMVSADNLMIVDKMLQELNEQNSVILEQVRVNRQEIYDILIANEFDNGAYLASSAKINKVQARLTENISKRIGQVAGQLTKDDRMILAELLRDPPAMPHRLD